MTGEYRPTVALFYCQNIPQSSEDHRRVLEKKYGQSMRLFPIPCSGRLEPIHLLRALEEFADAAYVVTCPERACRYLEGNRRAMKRVQRTQDIISSIGLEKERVGIIIESSEAPEPMGHLAERLLERALKLALSPVLKGAMTTKEHPSP